MHTIMRLSRDIFQQHKRHSIKLVEKTFKKVLTGFISCSINGHYMRKKMAKSASRRNLYFPDDVFRLAEKRAKQECRTVSNYLHTLVVRDVKSIGEEGNGKAA